MAIQFSFTLTFDIKMISSLDFSLLDESHRKSLKRHWYLLHDIGIFRLLYSVYIVYLRLNYLYPYSILVLVSLLYF